MQKFTRSLTREIEVGGERLAVTLSEEGLSVRPVGARRPPHTMSWPAWICACVAHDATQEPTPEQLEEAVKVLRGTPTRKRTSGKSKEGTDETAEGPATNEAPPTGETPVPPAAAPISPTAALSPAQGHGLPDLLARLDRWLAAHRPRFHQGLRPGATPGELDALAAALGGGPLPDELRTLLSWHNGQSPDVMGAFEQSWNLLSADLIADAKKDLDAEGHEGWQRSWVPFMDDDNGDFLCLDAAAPGAPVRACWRGRPEHPVVAPSLAAWLGDFVSALERGAYVEDPERGTFHRR